MRTTQHLMVSRLQRGALHLLNTQTEVYIEDVSKWYEEAYGLIINPTWIEEHIQHRDVVQVKRRSDGRRLLEYGENFTEVPRG